MASSGISYFELYSVRCFRFLYRPKRYHKMASIKAIIGDLFEQAECVRYSYESYHMQILTSL